PKVWTFRPSVLLLEDRIAPATILQVTTINDNPTGVDPTHLSLRQAIDIVNLGLDTSYTIELLANTTYGLTTAFGPPPPLSPDHNASGAFSINPVLLVNSVLIEAVFTSTG